MRIHKITLTVIDFDHLGLDDVISVLENSRYPNRCIAPNVIGAETRDCGEWHDDHPLNKPDTKAKEEIERLLGDGKE